jgi:hypothetical protein
MIKQTTATSGVKPKTAPTLVVKPKTAPTLVVKPKTAPTLVATSGVKSVKPMIDTTAIASGAKQSPPPTNPVRRSRKRGGRGFSLCKDYLAVRAPFVFVER